MDTFTPFPVSYMYLLSVWNTFIPLPVAFVYLPKLFGDLYSLPCIIHVVILSILIALLPYLFHTHIYP